MASTTFKTFQVTIGAGATQVYSQPLPVREVIIQNNATHVIRFGGDNVSTSLGIQLDSGTATPSPGGSASAGPFRVNNVDLSDIWIAGTQNDVVDILYIP